ncbi:uncharacterized protein LOC126719221 [Quercus robur]|uniref:uncharacterized protein LOC126719221 n=1 Tax=Quercus robur TaxID=38942 RepID=UPI002163306B|nr:uncharacterized protein LOC126719221 [Quercus robur]
MGLPKLVRNQVVAWAPPSASRYKVNVDGAVFASRKSVGVGVLIRDSYGQVVAAISKKINAPLGPLEAEVKAWEEGVKFVREVGVYDFKLEGDSLVVFNALRGLSTTHAAVESVIRGVLMEPIKTNELLEKQLPELC